MSEGQEKSGDGRFQVRATSDSHFSWLRTRLAVDRTILAWVRTAVSLIAFGFTIVQFFDRMQSLPGAAPAQFPQAPRYLGLALIGCGVGALAIAVWEYFYTLGYLRGPEYAAIADERRRGKRSPVIAAVVVLGMVGLFAFFAVLFRLV